MSPAWNFGFRTLYATLALLDPLIRAWWSRAGMGNVVELVAPGRRTGRTRSVMVGLLHAGGRQYLGHPNGPVAWTYNVEAAGGGELEVHGVGRIPFRVTRLEPGPEREAAIRATWQHPFPGNVIYRLARRHILAVGVYYRVEPT